MGIGRKRNEPPAAAAEETARPVPLLTGCDVHRGGRFLAPILSERGGKGEFKGINKERRT